MHAAYIQDWLTQPIDADGHKQAEWRTDPARAGASACLADIGVHAHNLAGFVTGLDLDEVAADLTTFVPGPPARRQCPCDAALPAAARGAC